MYSAGNSNGAANSQRLGANSGTAELADLRGIGPSVTQMLRAPQSSGQGQYKYDCTQALSTPQEFGTDVVRYSGCNVFDLSNNVIFLDRHNVQCNSDEVLAEVTAALGLPLREPTASTFLTTSMPRTTRHAAGSQLWALPDDGLGASCVRQPRTLEERAEVARRFSERRRRCRTRRSS